MREDVNDLIVVRNSLGLQYFEQDLDVELEACEFSFASLQGLAQAVSGIVRRGRLDENIDYIYLKNLLKCVSPLYKDIEVGSDIQSK